jgi:glycosyltransferase involved in cell wall biosynthesis
VATAVGDVPLLFTDDECGRLVSPGDEDAFTAALQQAITDGRRRGRWREASHRKAQAWSVEQMVRGYEDAFRAVIGPAVP